MKEELFARALGPTAPWRMAQGDIRAGESVIRFEIENAAKRLPCPACGATDQPVHDRTECSWRHLFFGGKAVLHTRISRVVCRECEKTTKVSALWACPGSGFTQMLLPTKNWRTFGRYADQKRTRV